MGILSTVGTAAGAYFGGPAGAAIGGSIGSSIEENKNRKREEKRQREFAQNSVTWRVADAKRAGIHPLAALGMSPNQAYPISIGSDPSSPITRMINKMYDAEMQQTIMEGDEAKAKANYYNAMAEDIRNPQLGGNSLVGNEQIVQGKVQNKPQVLQLTGGTHQTGKSVPQERLEQEYGGIIGEGYGVIRALDDFIVNPGINWRDKKERELLNGLKRYLKKVKREAKTKKKTGQMNRRRK